MLNDHFDDVIMLYAVMLNVITLSTIATFFTTMLNDIMLSVVMLYVVVPLSFEIGV